MTIIDIIKSVARGIGERQVARGIGERHNMIDVMLDAMYAPYEKELEIFGEKWCGPKKYKYMERVIVAVYESEKDDDGQTCLVYCTAAPARFYNIEVLSGHNSVGEPQKGYNVSAGSGMAQVIKDIAESIAMGMIGFSELKER